MTSLAVRSPTDRDATQVSILGLKKVFFLSKDNKTGVWLVSGLQLVFLVFKMIVGST